MKLKIYVPTEVVEAYKGAISKRSAVLGTNFEVLANTATGIETPSLENEGTEVARYTTSGIRISAPTKGLNIIKLSNGRVIKRIEK